METETLLLMAVVLVSGCAHTAGNSNGNGKQGLEIVKFDVSDSRLSPGQRATVDLRLRNHHRDFTEINSISLYNTAFLEVEEGSWEERCNPPEIKTARKDYSPEMECSWIIRAPEDMSGFRSKAVEIKLNLNYSASLTNRRKPLKLQFKPLERIENREEITHTYSNSEVKLAVSTENPAPNEGAIVNFRLDSMGPGRVVSAYDMDYQPVNLFRDGDCKTRVKPVVEDTAEFSCQVSMEDGARVTRNLIFSISYKYVKSPSLDIEVVEP